MKRGFIYKLKNPKNNPHRIVLMEDYNGTNNRIKAIAFTHNEKGCQECPNIKFPKEYIVNSDETGKPFEFQWEEQSKNRSTSIISKGFLKVCEKIKPKPIGRITEKGMLWIEKQNLDYCICDISIKEKVKKESK